MGCVPPSSHSSGWFDARDTDASTALARRVAINFSKIAFWGNGHPMLLIAAALTVALVVADLLDLSRRGAAKEKRGFSLK